MITKMSQSFKTICFNHIFNVWNLEPEPRCLSPNLNVSLPQVNIFKVIIKYITPVNHVSDYKFFVCAFKSHRA